MIKFANYYIKDTLRQIHANAEKKNYIDGTTHFREC